MFQKSVRGFLFAILLVGLFSSCAQKEGGDSAVRKDEGCTNLTIETANRINHYKRTDKDVTIEQSQKACKVLAQLLGDNKSCRAIQGGKTLYIANKSYAKDCQEIDQKIQAKLVASNQVPAQQPSAQPTQPAPEPVKDDGKDVQPAPVDYTKVPASTDKANLRKDNLAKYIFVLQWSALLDQVDALSAQEPVYLVEGHVYTKEEALSLIANKKDQTICTAKGDFRNFPNGSLLQFDKLANTQTKDGAFYQTRFTLKEESERATDLSVACLNKTYFPKVSDINEALKVSAKIINKDVK